MTVQRLNGYLIMQLRYLQLMTYLAAVAYLANILMKLPLADWSDATTIAGDHISGVLVFLAVAMQAAWYLSRSWKGLLFSVLLPLFVWCSGEVYWSLMTIASRLVTGLMLQPIPGSDPITIAFAFFTLLCFAMRLDKYFRKSRALVTLLTSTVFLLAIMISFDIFNTSIYYDMRLDFMWHLIWFGGFMLAAKYAGSKVNLHQAKKNFAGSEIQRKP